MMNSSLSLRPVESADDAFVYEVYASTRQDVEAWGWPEAIQQNFLRMQFEARRRSYAAQWPTAESSVVLIGGDRAGTLIVWRGPDQIRLVDVALLPQFRSHGHGTELLQFLAEAAQTAGCPVRLSVARGNRAQRLYERFGFRVIGEDPMYLEMERTS